MTCKRFPGYQYWCEQVIQKGLYQSRELVTGTSPIICKYWHMHTHPVYAHAIHICTHLDTEESMF